MGEISRAGLGAVERGGVVGRVASVGKNLVVLTAVALRSGRAGTTSAFTGTGETFFSRGT